MLSVSEFMQSLNKNQLFIKTTVQRDDFVNPPVVIHFGNNSVRIIDCKISHKNYLFIIEGKTQTGQEIQLFWSEFGVNILNY